ncbi:hypothetical protein [Moorena sp. SIO3H5]|uniref:hypothetical protein n=1 Tax=Moorena sp. SIO3H5 TaxID=2607834 RepID=UPI0013B98E61|nr:hypothetical protein [Moorena sp. SIO3H5]NEO71309.1 hypothetical protein [Moorena sp. SIO3H5]
MRYTLFLPSSLFTLTYYLLPAPCSLLPAPCSLLPAPCSLLPAPCSLLPAPLNPIICTSKVVELLYSKR